MIGEDRKEKKHSKIDWGKIPETRTYIGGEKPTCVLNFAIEQEKSGRHSNADT